MSYIKNVWENGDKVTSEKLNNIENGIENVTNKTKVVEKEFKEFEVGDEFPYGYELTIDNSNGAHPSKIYYFATYDSENVRVGYKIFIDSDGLFNVIGLIDDADEDERTFEGSVILSADLMEHLNFDIDESNIWELVDIADFIGTGLLGEYVDKQLTAQEVYDSTKLKDNVVYTKTITDTHSIAFGKLADGLYELFLYCQNYYEYSAIFRIVNGITTGYINIVFEDEDEEEVNGSFRVKQGEYDDEGYYVLEFYAPITSDTRNLAVNTNVTITKIL